MRHLLVAVTSALAFVLMLAPPAAAQRGAGGIAGVVKDVTGGVLPGVTVEASSPVLIERARTAVTDDTGQYKLLDLRPGVYVVTFTLAGFNTVKHEGIELTSDFTAAVNADMRVGSVEETLTVSGRSPIVDIQNAVQQRVMTRDVLDAIPSGKYYQNIGALIPGIVIGGVQTNATQDVGGTLGRVGSTLGIHGSRPRDQQIFVDGLSVAVVSRNDTTTFVLQDGNIEEMSLMVGVNPAESESGGVRVNMVPKDGGNTFRANLFSNFTNRSFQSDNLDAQLIQAGLTAPNRMDWQADVNPSGGGPIVRDKLWFYAAYRHLDSKNFIGGMYFNQDPKAWIYRPDLTRQAYTTQPDDDANFRLTYQMSPRHKFSGYYDYDHNCDCYRMVSANTAPEAGIYTRFKNQLYQGTWSSPVTNRLLMEAGFSLYRYRDNRDAEAEATEDPIVNQSIGLNYRARNGGPFHIPGHNYNYRVSASYVTGSHAFKVGHTWMQQSAWWQIFNGPNNLTYTVLNAAAGGVVPSSITYYATPYSYKNSVDPNIALFAQDQWTLRRLTVNGGLRFDWLKTKYLPSELPATQWMTARSFSGGDVLDWKDLSPRLSAVYDLFGNGKTAIKGSFSRYVLQQGAFDLTSSANPVQASNNTTTRTWTDANGDFLVQGDPLDPATNGELGVSSNRNFGRTVFTTSLDPELTQGFNVRPYNWEVSAGLQHELLPRVSMNVNYYRRWFGNFTATENRAYTPADYSEYCITAPSDPRLPGGGGYPVCGLFDVDPAKVGQVNNLTTRASRFGDVKETWNGVDVTVNARLQAGVILQGGMSTGRTAVNSCAIWGEHPNVSIASSLQASASTAPGGSGQVGDFCDQKSALLTQVKFLSSYPLPWWGIQMSATFQNFPGQPTFANYVATNAVIRPSLGRNLSSGANGTVTFNIVRPGEMYLDRITQVDLRASKIFLFGQRRLTGMVDLYNLFNANTVNTANNSYGTNGVSWLVPQVILAGRIVKFAVQVTF